MIQLGKLKMKKERLIFTLLFMPFLVYIIAFKFVPLVGWGLAFIRYRPGLALSQCEFVGFDNFIKIFSDWDRLSQVLTNTFVLSILGILVSPFPLLFAILLNEVPGKKFKKFVQTFTTIPHFVSWVIVFALAFSLFSTEGVLNTVLVKIGLGDKTTNLLASKNATWWLQAALNLWKSFGWSAIIYFASISSIDSDLYEAAALDGAGRFQKIRYITIPSLKDTYFVILLLQISNFLNTGLDQYLAFYNSIISDKIMVLDLYAYRLGLVAADYSYSTAVSIVKTVVSIVLLFSINSLSKKIRGVSIV